VSLEPGVTRMFLNLDTEKQQRIVDAAVEEFAGKGFARASMNVVVERAGISKGAIFKYFQSKSGLFGFIYRIALNQVKDYLRAVRNESTATPFFPRLERVMCAGVEFVRRHPGLARIYYHIRFTGDAPASREILHELQRESRKFLEALIAEAMARGEVRQDLDPRVAAFMLDCIMDRFLQAHYFQFLAASPAGDRGELSRSARWIPEMISLVRRGMEAPSGGNEAQ
jgi:TetR/AcrR family transcriptional regulator